jgi:phosphoribosylformimino-5-aminoimidazole carboxamide ribotide isomerase
MLLLPAIDIRRGRVVRLTQGQASRETIYDDHPVAVAERFVSEGAEWLHVVDLDRAFGEGDNSQLVRQIVAAVEGRAGVQLGGGLRTLPAIRQGLDAGAARVVIGTAAVRDPDLVLAALAQAGLEHIAVGIDARDGVIAIRGWREAGGERAAEVASRVVEQGVKTLVYTDVSRDGMLQGPDIGGAVGLQAPGVGIIASGGIASLDDLRRVRDAGLAGAIVGRALYEGRMTVEEAVTVVKSEA